jgi:tetratricopeptide (TPR) repeat protein
MAVSFPLVLLVLDAYPLARLRRPGLGRVLTEKIPFALLAMASALLTLHAQQAAGAMRALADLPLRARLSVAIQAPVAYLGKTLWPSELRALYSYPMLSGLASWWEARQALASRLLASVLLVMLCWALKRRRRPLVVGLLSYLVMLLPVLGIVQVGPQAMAERYTYLPGIALAILAGAALGMLWERAAISSRFWLATLAAIFALVTASLSWLSIKQIAVWHNSESLWTQVLACEPGNVEAHNSRADFRYQRGDFGQALADYTAALASPPSVSPTHAAKRRAAIFNDRAVTLVQLGRLDEAVTDESEAIRLRPGQADYYTNRARMFQRMGRADAAIADWQQARTLHASEGSTSPP